MKVLTWNINGLRAVKGKSTKQLLDSLQADIICLQETKVTRDMLDEPTAVVEGYESYFSCSRKKTGYSGTANYCSTKAAPVKAEEGLTGILSNQNDTIVQCYGNTESLQEDLNALDAEGRCIITQHQIKLPNEKVEYVALINVYVPRAGDREDRRVYKLKFLSLLQSRAEALLKEKVHVIILGDLNLTHTSLDNCDPQSDKDFQFRSSRIWFNEMLQMSERDASLPSSDSSLAEYSFPGLKGGYFSDVYRQLHPKQENSYTNWCSSTDARKANYGRRLDYILIDTELSHLVLDCEIMAEVEGSDHCPVIMILDCDPVPSTISPLLCTKFMPEFKGQQQKLSAFFTKSVKKEFKQGSSPNSVSPSSSQEEQSKIISSSPMKKSASLSLIVSIPKTTLRKNSTVGTNSKASRCKRGVASSEKGVAKKAKTMQDETGSKQVSLTTFFTKTNASKEKAQTLSVLSKMNVTNTNFNEMKEATVVNNVANEASAHGSSITEEGNVQPSGESTSQLSQCDYSQGTLNSQDSQISQDSYFTPEVTSSEDTHGSSPCLNEASTTTKITSMHWKLLLKGPDPPPLCPGHKEPCILKTVNKKGPNKDRKFYVCARPEGAPGNPAFRCNYFRWQNERKKKK